MPAVPSCVVAHSLARSAELRNSIRYTNHVTAFINVFFVVHKPEIKGRPAQRNTGNLPFRNGHRTPPKTRFRLGTSPPFEPTLRPWETSLEGISSSAGRRGVFYRGIRLRSNIKQTGHPHVRETFSTSFTPFSLHILFFLSSKRLRTVSAASDDLATSRSTE